MKTDSDQQVRDLERLCFKHWLLLMLASLLDAPSPESAVEAAGSTRTDVLGSALSCPRCRARNGLHPPLVTLGAGQRDGSGRPGVSGWPLPVSSYELYAERPSRGRFRLSRWVIAGVVGVAIGVPAVGTLAPHGAGATATTGVDITSLAVGDCVRDMAGSGGFAPDFVDVVDCSQPHTDEVYATFQLRDGSYPGDRRVELLAGRGCDKRFAAYVGISVNRTTLDQFTVTPSKETWSFDDDRGVLCTVGSPGHPTKGSVRHSGR
jgi:hypothetical protein